MLLICGCVSACGCGSGSADGAAEFQSNLCREHWPTYEDVTQWATSEGHSRATGEDGTSNTDAMREALMAAIGSISEKTGLHYYEVDEAGATIYYDGAGDVVDEATGSPRVAKIPQPVRLATIMYAARLYQRRQSINGTLGASAFGGVARVTGIDPDIKALLAPYRRVGIA